MTVAEKILILGLATILGIGAAAGHRDDEQVLTLRQQIAECRTTTTEDEMLQASLLKQLDECRGQPRMVERGGMIEARQ